MRTESTTTALLLVLSAVFETLPPQARRRAAILIEDSTDLTDDMDAKRLMPPLTPRNLDRLPGFLPDA
jgi:hypothetical protein